MSYLDERRQEREEIVKARRHAKMLADHEERYRKKPAYASKPPARSRTLINRPQY